jgi:hypothetical protein
VNDVDETRYEPPAKTSATEGELRKAAVKRLEDRRGLQAHLLAYLLVNGFLVGIWAITGGGFFWPMFPMFGWGIGVAFHIWAVVSPEPSEEKIKAEMQRLAGGR